MAIQAQVRINERMSRRIREITEVVGFDPETRELLTNTVFEWDSATDTHRYLGKSYVLEQVMESRHMSEEAVEAEWRNRVEVLQWMMDNNVRHVTDVARVFSRYYRDPKGLLAGVRAAEPAEKITAGEHVVATPPRALEAAPQAVTPDSRPPGTRGPGDARPEGTADLHPEVDHAIDAAGAPLVAPRRRKWDPAEGEPDEAQPPRKHKGG